MIIINLTKTEGRDFYFIMDLITEFSSGLANKELKKMKENDPEKYQQTIKMFSNAAELGIHFLRESKEFREAFARIHNEFMNYPESESTIKKAIEKGKQYKNKQ
mgnify:CR=1 FL=1